MERYFTLGLQLAILCAVVWLCWRGELPALMRRLGDLAAAKSEQLVHDPARRGLSRRPGIPREKVGGEPEEEGLELPLTGYEAMSARLNQPLPGQGGEHSGADNGPAESRP